MHVMMISLDASLLGDPHGNTVQRHMEYARRIGDLTIVTYNPTSQPKTVRHFAGNFTVYPTNTRPALFPWAAYRLAARLLREKPADVVTTQDPFATGLVGLLLKWRFGVALDMQNHSSFFNNAIWIAERPFRNRLLHALGKFVTQRADTHRVLTPGEKQHYLAMGIPGDRIAVLSTPTHVDFFAQAANLDQLAMLRTSLGIAEDAPVLLWVGQPVAFKNVDLLLVAYQQVRAAYPSARLLMVGDFSSRPDFVRRARAEAVIFAGRMDHDQLPAYYQMADVYVHSSRYEGFGKVLVESLAAGTPVVATRGDGPCEIVRDGETGRLTAHTPDALAAAILDLLDDPARAKVVGETGQRDVLERFDYERQLDAIVESFRTTSKVRRERTP
jgi:glycosyltransferase involved in cell wall biosynthesis